MPQNNHRNSTVLILGNGFDLSMKLKTSYKDFYDSDYCPKDYPAPLIAHLNRKWKENIEKVRWYDLENELLEYYKYPVSGEGPSRFNDVISDKEKDFLENIKLGRYLLNHLNNKNVEQARSLYQKRIIVGNPPAYRIPYLEDLLCTPLYRDRKALEKIKQGLCQYLNTLSSPDASNHFLAYHVLNALESVMAIRETVCIYTFNYTHLPWDFDARFKGHIRYVHGRCQDGKVIIGTGDENILDKYSFLQKSFDNHFSPPPIVDDLDAADEIIIFGHSLGYNDRQYFKPFFKKQSSEGAIKRKTITIITKDDSSEEEIKRALQKLTDNNLSLLMSRNTVRYIKTDDIEECKTPLANFLKELRVGRDRIQTITEALISETS